MVKKKRGKNNNLIFFSVLAVLVLLSPAALAGKSGFEAGKNPGSFLAYSENGLFRPLGKKNILPPAISADRALAVFVNLDKNTERYLFQNQKNLSAPVASITKLMTAIVAMENYELSDNIVISAGDLDRDPEIGTAGNLSAGEYWTVQDLLSSMLIESSNSAAEALAGKAGRDKFINLMNKKAVALGLTDTRFYNPTGLDIGSGFTNISSPEDLKKIAVYIMKDYPLIAEICSTQEKDLYVQGKFHHKMKSTDVLLEEDGDYIWGKTGYTKEANGCIILISKAPFSGLAEREYVVTVIMGAEGKAGRFEEAARLKSWVEKSFVW
ncbi:MAG: serine hydrolase [Candidatus Pacebacteria bacterium]|nr:serine hydrolase [Candidatus Paceibacterota bacterium]